MKTHLFIALLFATLFGCAFLRPVVDDETGEFVDDSPAIRLAEQVIPLIPKSEDEDDSDLNWRELTMYGIVTAQNLFLAKRKFGTA